MASNPSVHKRQREMEQKERQHEKAELRKQRREARIHRTDGPPGVDPDIAGIVPGPQPTMEVEDESLG